MLPVNHILENEHVIAFYHPRPSASTHILIVPKYPHKNIAMLTRNESAVIVSVFEAADKVAQLLSLGNTYRITVNSGEYQDVMQVHFHLTVD